MRIQRIPAVVLALAAALLPVGPTGAATRTVKAVLVKDRPADLTIAEEGVRVLRYRFNRVIRGGENPFKVFTGGPAFHFDVLNDGKEARDFALAVALFDREGGMVGVGTQSHAGKLDPGEEKEVKVVLKDVNQEVPRATTIVVTLETRR